MLNKIIEKVNAFTQLRYMRIIMNGFMGVTAITICGSLFTLLKSIPFGPWTNFLATSGLGALLSIPVAITTDAIALYVVLSVANQTAKEFGEDGFRAALVALGAFLLVTPFETTVMNAGEAISITNVIPQGVIGAQGIFLAMFVAIFAARLYVFFLQKGWTIKMPESVPESVSKTFASLIPGGLTFVVFLVVRFVMSLTAFGTAQNLIYTMLQKPLAAVGGGIIGVVVFLLVSSICWTFGIHGVMVAFIGMMPIYQLMNSENLAAFAAGNPAPHPEWAILGMITLGGSGATLALNALMVSPLCKSEQFKTLGKLALPSSLFNINEPLIFGTPLIMNPLLAIPFITTPLLNLGFCMIMYKIGFFVPTGASVNSFMPFGFYGAFVTGSWQGIVMNILVLVLDLFIWLPFFKAADAKVFKNEQEFNA